MALAPPNQKPVLSVKVNGTMHFPQRSAYDEEAKNLCPGVKVGLQLDPSNSHDSTAVKVKYNGRQIGWVPASFSKQVTQVILSRGALYGVIRSHEYHSTSPYDCLLEIDLFHEKPPAPRIIVTDLYFCEEYPKDLVRGQLKVGTKWRMHTNDGRTSVTIARPGGGNLMRFRKKALPDGLRYEGMNAFVLQEQPLIIELCPLGQSPIDNPYGAAPPLPPGTYPAPSLSPNVPPVSAAKAAINTALADARAASISAAATLDAFDVSTQTFTKETTMSKFDSIIASNKSAAQTGAVMEAGRIANNQVAKLAAKQLPMMVRGYADTAIGKVVIANLAAQGAKYFRPEDTRLAALTDAMMVQAFQVLMQTVDIEGFVDELLDSKDIKRAMSKLSDDGEEEAAPARTRRAAAAK